MLANYTDFLDTFFAYLDTSQTGGKFTFRSSRATVGSLRNTENIYSFAESLIDDWEEIKSFIHELIDLQLQIQYDKAYFSNLHDKVFYFSKSSIPKLKVVIFETNDMSLL